MEFLQSIVAEIAEMGGEAAFTRVERIDTIPDAEIIALFRRRKERDYRELARALDLVERRMESLRQGGSQPAIRGRAAQLAKIRKTFDESRRTDFFVTECGLPFETRLAQAFAALQALPGAGKVPAAGQGIARGSVDNYQGKRWVTSKTPFVDRMTSAWLIRRFIDPTAVFGFLEEAEVPDAGADTVVFDVAGGEFTHAGDACTFEVLVRSFDLKDPGLAKVAEIVHDLHIKDDRYHAVEAAGVEEILAGILGTARDDADALERGIAIFELLYAAKRPR